MQATFTCPVCGSGTIVPTHDVLVCGLCGQEFWKTDETHARELQDINERSNELFLAGCTADAEAGYREAIRLCRSYVESNPDAFLPFLSTALDNLGVVLFEKGFDGEANRSTARQ